MLPCFLPSVFHLQHLGASSLLVFPLHRFLSRPSTTIRSYQRPLTIFSLRVDMQIEMRFWLCQRNFPSCLSAFFWLPPLSRQLGSWLFMAPKWPQMFQLSLWMAVSHSPGSCTKWSIQFSSWMKLNIARDWIKENISQFIWIFFNCYCVCFNQISELSQIYFSEIG